MPQTCAIEPYQYFLKPGFLLVNTEDTIVRTVLGNCVAVTLFDPVCKFGGINHFILPKPGWRAPGTAQYGSISIPALVRLLAREGADPRRLEAQIFGGASHRSLRDGDIGVANVRMAKKTLRKLRIPVVSEDIGGMLARKLVYNTGTNESIVLKVDQIRRSDWVLPGMDLRRVGVRCA